MGSSTPAFAGGGFGIAPIAGGTRQASTAQPGQMLPQPGRGLSPPGFARQGPNGIGGVASAGVLPVAPPSGSPPYGASGPGMPANTGAMGALQVANNTQIGTAAQLERQAVEASQEITEPAMTGLAAYISRQWEMMNRHRLALGIADRLLASLRAFNGQYDAQRLQEIKRFGGSDVYARITPSKCRGATSLLRDIYINKDRPWGFAAPADVDIPLEQYRNIAVAVQGEVENMVQAGQPPGREQVRDRVRHLLEAAREAAKKQEKERVQVAEDKVETLLVQGNFYVALAECLADLTIFPYVVLKGPTVRMMPTVEWVNGVPQVSSKPVVWYERVSPFDFWFSPGVARIQDAQCIERRRMTRAGLNDLLDLPGYDHEAVRACLRDYPYGLTDILDYTESPRSILESRENPQWNETGLIDMLEFQGNIQGQMLIDSGLDPKKISDPMRDYMCVIWKVGRYVIKIQLNPSPRKRHSYYLTSFEKVPGTPIGNSLPDILADVQDLGNVALRSLANNMAFASGPQVVVDDNRLAPSEDGESFYPWKRWHARMDPFANTSQALAPITFFQPQSNAQELMSVYQFLLQLGDDQSAVPRYITSGTGATGGAQRTASGLAMLMGNAGKVLQTVAGNVDLDIIEQILEETKDLVLLTDETDVLDGTEKIVAKGTEMATQRETERSRQLEFLQVTNNPLDMQVMGLPGRAEVLKAVSRTIGLPGDEIVPDPDDMRRQMQQEEALQQRLAMMGVLPGTGPGGGPPTNAGPGSPPPGAPGNTPPRPTKQGGPMTNTVQPRIAGGVM